VIEIANKEHLTQPEIIALIQEYIFQVKGVKVEPFVHSNPLVIQSEVRTMLEMMPFAIAYFKEKS